MTKVWAGTVTSCDLCDDDFTTAEPMYDARVGGSWGNICHKCFTNFHCELGAGRGQKYEWQDTTHGAQWVKVEG